MKRFIMAFLAVFSLFLGFRDEGATEVTLEDQPSFYVEKTGVDGCNFIELVRKMDLKVKQYASASGSEYSRVWLESARFQSSSPVVRIKQCPLRSAEKRTYWMRFTDGYVGENSQYEFEIARYISDEFALDMGNNAEGFLLTLPVVVSVVLETYSIPEGLLEMLFRAKEKKLSVEGVLRVEGRTATNGLPEKPGDIYYLRMSIRPSVINGQKVDN